ncbi:serine/threonine-protein kinase [Nonomuraea sp. NPDC050556]|uniref:serine/threonine-protein kinase n=1 Tax=Nonomuraea sp. NPDC050556 TaxID=3364369 RepID=UPI00378CEDB9
MIEPLGSGGMGRVWLARDELLGREVAVKELTLPEGDRAEAVTRAVREAQATAQLRHTSIVALHDVVVADDRPWLVMELLRGRTLAEQITAYGPLPPGEVARVGADLLDALTVAHGRGLQHRDVKPGNVFLTDGGRVVLTDFGISRQEGQETLTQDGLTIGSPGFIAPERLDGERGGPASDLWSLGATLYVASEGRPPYEGSPSDRVRATLTGQPPPARPPIGPLLAAMMARRPAARPHPDTVLRTLRQLARGDEVPTQPVSRRRKVGVTVGIALAVVAATTAFLVVRKEAAPAPFTLPVDVCSLLGTAFFQLQEIKGVGDEAAFQYNTGKWQDQPYGGCRALVRAGATTITVEAVGSTVPAGPEAKVMELRESCTGALKVARAIAQSLAANPGS